MTPLPTLGGNNAEAGQINNLGEVAGNAENSTPDSTCGPAAAPQKLQEKPVFWKNGEIKELPTFPVRRPFYGTAKPVPFVQRRFFPQHV